MHLLAWRAARLRFRFWFNRTTTLAVECDCSVGKFFYIDAKRVNLKPPSDFKLVIMNRVFAEFDPCNRR